MTSSLKSLIQKRLRAKILRQLETDEEDCLEVADKSLMHPGLSDVTSRDRRQDFSIGNSEAGKNTSFQNLLKGCGASEGQSVEGEVDIRFGSCGDWNQLIIDTEDSDNVIDLPSTFPVTLRELPIIENVQAIVTKRHQQISLSHENLRDFNLSKSHCQSNFVTSVGWKRGHLGDNLSPTTKFAACNFVSKRQRRASRSTPRTMATQRWLESCCKQTNLKEVL